MPQIRPIRDVLSIALAAGLFLAGSAVSAHAQGELEKTPWATTMVYPVGDPLDYGRPAPGEAKGFLLSRGVKTHGRRHHEGLDLTNRASGGEVRAVAPGLVVTTRTGWSGGWGNMVVLAHRMPGGDLLFSLFAHLLPGSISVREGEVVALGQPLGRIGSTGHSSGPHLHLEFRELASSKPLLEQPLAQAWMKATIVDPLRMLSIMMPRGSSNPLLAALPAAARVGARDEALAAFVTRGGLSPALLDHADQALTRGELYRFAHGALARSGARTPARWSTLRPQLQKLSARLPAPSRAAFASARMPRREADAGAAASLEEVVTVFTALERAGKAAPSLGSVMAAPTQRELVEEQFPHGLAALEKSGATAALVAAGPAAAGPPSVSRRQASLLWSYLEGGRRTAPGSASAATLP
jgi:hypothetical protein